MTRAGHRDMSPPTKDAGGRLIRNTAINGLATVSGLIVTLLLTPLMLDRLGSDAFGVWALALTLTVSAGYLTLTDLGLQQAATRFMADARRRADPAAVGAIFTLTLAIFSVVGAVVAVVIVALAPTFANLFSIPLGLRHAAVISFALVGAQVIFDLPMLAFRAVLESDQRFGAIRVIELFRSLLFAGLTVGVLLTGHGVVSVAASSACAAAIGLSGYIAIVVVSEPAARISREGVRLAQATELAKFSGSLFLLRVMSVIYRQMDKVIIGVVLPVASIATYEVANRIQGALALLTGVAASALLPLTVMSRLDVPALRQLFLRVTSYSVALLMPITLSVLIYARPLIVAWVGHAQEGATGATRLFAVWIALGLFDAAATTMLVAIGRLRPIVILSAIWVAANLILSVALVHVWGISGVVAGTVISYLPLLIAYTTISLNEFEISVSEWARKVLLPNLPGSCLQVVVCLVTLHLIEELPARAAVLIGGAGGTAVSISTYLVIGIRKPERDYLRRMLVRAAQRAPREAST